MEHDRILEIVTAIVPTDELERRHQQDVVDWLKSGDPIFRIRKPDVPKKHLVSYFVVIDPSQRSLLLIDHVKAELWLPTGGHVEPGEDPETTVEREALEELGLSAKFLNHRAPLFVTVTVTVGKTAGHTDVSLWYVLEGSASVMPAWDRREFRDCRWFSTQELLAMNSAQLDPHLHRFTNKLEARLFRGKR